MKTVIVLLSLVTFATALPTTLKDAIKDIDEDIVNFPDTKIREKKSPLNDPSQVLSIHHGQEDTTIQRAKLTEHKISSLEKRNLNVRKPIIVKKKFGYHVFRDSDEEMAHADPNENCGKQVKVKLCDSEPVLHLHSHDVNSKHPNGVILEKEMEHSIKMAKEAVENLQQDLWKMEQNSVAQTNSKESFRSDTELHQDIENARKVLEHIQQSIDNFESIDFQSNTPKMAENERLNSEDAERLNQWKEAIENIHKNFEIARNIEDAFNFEAQSELNSDNKDLETIRETEPLVATEEKSNVVDLAHDLNQSNIKVTKGEHNKDSEQSSQLNTSMRKDESNEDSNDMFVSPTNNKETKMNLHSENLVSENVLKQMKSSNNHETNVNEKENKEYQTNTPLMKTSVMADDHVDSERKTLSNEKDLTEREKDLNTPKESLDEEKEKKGEFMRELSDSGVINKNEFDSTGQKSNLKEEAIEDENRDFKDAMLTSKHDIMKSETAKDASILDEQVELTDAFTNNTPHAKEVDLHQERNENKQHKIAEEQINENNFSHDTFSTQLGQQKAQDEFKTVTDFTNKEQVPSSTNELMGHHISNERTNAHFENNNNVKFQLNEDQTLHNSFFMPSNSQLQPARHQLNDHSMQFFKTETETQNLNELLRWAQEMRNKDNMLQASKAVSEFHTRHLKPTSIKSTEFLNPAMQENMNMQKTENQKLGQQLSNGHHGHWMHTSMKSNDFHNQHPPIKDQVNMRIADNQNLGEPSIDSQELDKTLSIQPFKSALELNDVRMLKIPLKSAGLQQQNSALREETTMRMTSDQKLRQQLTDNHESHDHLMPWAQENAREDHSAHLFDTTVEQQNAHHMKDHLHMPTSNFDSNFNFDNSHDLSAMRSRMPDHMHIMKQANPSALDSSMQPSTNFDMRDNNMHWNQHHGMARSSYASGLPIAGGIPGSVGVFPTANTGCGIPLMLSCSPSVVSGSLGKVHSAITAPAYRSGDDFMYYMKRDANTLDELSNIKIPKSHIPHTHKTEMLPKNV